MQEEGWGAKTINCIAKDLGASLPDMGGFSPRNLRYEAYPDFQILQQVVAKLLWGHNILLLQKLKTGEERLWYAQKTLENGAEVYSQFGSKTIYMGVKGKQSQISKRTLPQPQSDLAQQMTRAPYCFQFLTLEANFRERERENSLIHHVQHLLSEFGRGFAFCGRQRCLGSMEKTSSSICSFITPLYTDLLR